MNVHYCTNFVESGRTMRVDVLIEESALNETVFRFYLRSGTQNLLVKEWNQEQNLFSIPLS